MALRLERFAHRYTIGFYATVIATAGLAAGGCGGAPIAPPSPAAQEPKTPEPQEAAWNPFVVAEPGGRILITYYGGRGESEHRLLFTRSLDGGVTWLPEPVQLDSPPLKDNRFGFHRLETNGNGRLSVTWAIERKEETFWRVREVRNRQSSDSGTTWTGEALRWQFHQQGNYPTSLTDRDGVLHLLWIEGPSAGGIPRFVRTTGAGKGWAAEPLTIPGAKVTPIKHRGRDLPVHREPAWPVLAGGPNGALYAVWQEASQRQLFGTGTDILFNRSDNGGGTWLESSLRLSTPPPSPTRTARIPVVAVNQGGEIYVVWEDFRHNTSDLYFNRSLDKGVTWLSQDLWLTAVRPPLASATNPILLADTSGNLYLLWEDIREVPHSLYFNRSLDKGVTWLPHAIRLDRHAPNEITRGHRLAHDDSGHVYAAWAQGSETKVTVRFRHSDDYGATWTEKDQILDSGQGKDGPRVPWLTADGKGSVYVVWSSDRTGRYHLYLNRSLDHGRTWLPQDVRIPGSPLMKTRGS